jgi:hypothetical protein
MSETISSMCMIYKAFLYQQEEAWAHIFQIPPNVAPSYQVPIEYIDALSNYEKFALKNPTKGLDDILPFSPEARQQMQNQVQKKIKMLQQEYEKAYNAFTTKISTYTKTTLTEAEEKTKLADLKVLWQKASAAFFQWKNELDQVFWEDSKIRDAVISQQANFNKWNPIYGSP